MQNDDGAVLNGTQCFKVSDGEERIGEEELDAMANITFQRILASKGNRNDKQPFEEYIDHKMDVDRASLMSSKYEELMDVRDKRIRIPF
jgi:hypothetical protein